MQSVKTLGDSRTAMASTTKQDAALAREITVVVTVLGLAGALWLLIAHL